MYTEGYIRRHQEMFAFITTDFLILSNAVNPSPHPTPPPPPPPPPPTLPSTLQHNTECEVYMIEIMSELWIKNKSERYKQQV